MKPNILFITTDQQRPDMLGSSGHPCIRTPHLDMLASEGIVFNQAYSDCPVCIPARTTMITGIQSHIYGKPSYSMTWRLERERDKFLGALITKGGYQTKLVGKKHWHTEPDFKAGFESVIETRVRGIEHKRKYGNRPSVGIGANELTPMLDNCPEEMQDPNWCIQKSLDFFEQEYDSSQPFFLWVSTEDPHPANVAREPYYSMYDDENIPEPVFPEWAKPETCPYAIEQIRLANAHENMTDKEKRKAMGVYYGKVTNIDHQLGRLIGLLIQKGLWDNTIVVFTTDHGEHLFDYGTCFKSTFLEPAARIPFLVRFPANMKTRRGETSEALIELADLLPTFCDIAGVDAPEDVTGTSIMPLVMGTQNSIKEFLHGQIGNSHMFHDGKYKYLYFADDGAELLFDKTTDRMDEFDLSKDEELLKPIRERFIKHLQEENHEHLKDGKLVNLGKKIGEAEKYSVVSWKGLGNTGR